MAGVGRPTVSDLSKGTAMNRKLAIASFLVCAAAMLLAGNLFAADKAKGDKPKGKDYTGENLKKKDFTGKNLENAVFKEADMQEVVLINVFARGADFRGADLRFARLQDGDFTGCDFRESTFVPATAKKCDFTNANFEGVNFGQAKLDEVTFKNANLRKAKGFNFCIAVDFRGADLRGADLKGFVNLSDTTPTRFRGAKYSRSTRWPDGFDPKENYMVLAEDEKEEAKDDK